ncbi:hypothetical protein BH10BDE1_BH10BDE1_05790 [soil metagenome]
MNRAPRVATLAVGTEIVDGQISDRNSQWLSARVVEFGYEVVEHRAVADDRQKILRSLTELSHDVDVLFVTGGLGPTSDDFTRECVAEFLGEPLEWDEESWLNILERLKSRGATFTENQKQQCYYPRSAQILKNAMGTANGFTARTAKGIRIVSLPGPPREIESIWRDGLSDVLKLSLPSYERTLTLLRMMGLGEGALANRVEQIVDEALAVQPGIARPMIGYRAHAPYVEIKFWADPSQTKVVALAAKAIRHEFSEILVNEGKADVADDVLARISTEGLAGIKTLILDGVTQGQLYSRLLARATELKDAHALHQLAENCTCVIANSVDVATDKLKPEAKTSVLSLAVGSDDKKLLVGRGAREKVVELPTLAGLLRTERGRTWATEIALREWSRTT